MALALYRRYRPDTFEGVIGQNQVTIPLIRALDQGKITHAYLFSGPRGCGKTSSARILARCINCEQGPTSKPCGKCQSCKDLATGGPGSIDVVEIDAASHNGVDDARELRERAGFAPTRDRYKIFILDEAHMVTPQGFNALLKIVEEPPEHVMFIFATTEPDKVIGTIRSRTHHYPFRLVPPEVMGPYLESICQKEGIKAQKGVLRLAMRAGGGSMRDTLSVLDQLMIGSVDGVISLDSAVALLGFTPSNLIGDVVDALIEKDGAKLYETVQKVIVGGFDSRKFVEDLLGRLRDLLLLASAGVDSAKNLLGDLSPEDMQVLQRQSSQLTLRSLSRMAEIVNNAFSGMANAVSPRMNLEILVARLLCTRTDSSENIQTQVYAKNVEAPKANVKHFIGSADATKNANAAGFTNATESASIMQNNAQNTQKSVITNTIETAETVAKWPEQPENANASINANASATTNAPQILDVDEAWNNLVKSLPDDVREYVERNHVPKVRLDESNPLKRKLVLTFDEPISQHAFALALCTTAPYDGKKVPVVVMSKVKDVFGKDVSIAPDSVAENGQKVESVAKMDPQKLAQVKRELLMRKAGIVKGFGKNTSKKSELNADSPLGGDNPLDNSLDNHLDNPLDDHLDASQDDAWASMASAPMGDAIAPARAQNKTQSQDKTQQSQSLTNQQEKQAIKPVDFDRAQNVQETQEAYQSQESLQEQAPSQESSQAQTHSAEGINGAQEDECSMQDESLESATNLSIDDLEKMFEVKSVKEFGASDPNNPKNARARKRKQEE
ncbi:DNA polymerase III, subunit gamma and tau [Bifidobacteriaceae bacterium N170]|uniref:DNA polymerase III subunit gamma/tau n=1 Tax=Gardnerella vaginalis TaxID=2702 RepID=UPI000E21B0AF|nr:DNA polymerase III subunit gamma/tau [Gardnerella vaginalis]RDW99805.1 DNA polymerase III subunit gamma/tau [Gardnerella vaginalis]RFT41651.1 DNA polymerase III, subunit gamma and tau [Bifidobacteriaceae bacterium N170]